MSCMAGEWVGLRIPMTWWAGAVQGRGFVVTELPVMFLHVLYRPGKRKWKQSPHCQGWREGEAQALLCFTGF